MLGHNGLSFFKGGGLSNLGDLTAINTSLGN